MKTEKELLDHYNKNVTYESVITERTLATIFTLVDKQVPIGKTIVDLGCGTGKTCSLLTGHGNKVIGVDYSWARIRAALEMYHGLKLCRMEIFEYLAQVCPHTIDIFCMFDVLEHLERPSNIVSLARSLCNDFVIATIPINMEYHAHIQVWKDLEDVKAGLSPDVIVETVLNRRPYAVCKWKKR